MLKLRSLFAAAVLGASSLFLYAKPEPADFVLRNAKIITVDQKFSTAEALAVRADKIVAVGSDRKIAEWIGPNTQVMDAGGKTVMPGLYDSHVHSYKASVSEFGGGAPLVHSIAEAQDWIRKQAAQKKAGEWIVLERVYATRLKETRLPTKAELDEPAPLNPVLWNSGPVAVVNSKALELSGITRDTPNPTPGEIVKDPKTGEPTGILRNAAQLLKNPKSNRPPTAQEQREAVKHLHHLYNEQGITSIGERRTESEAIDLFRDMEKTGELTVRVNCTRMMEPVPKSIGEAIAKLDELTTGTNKTADYGPTGHGDDWVRIGPLKVLLDGGMLIGTAYMREPWGVHDVYQITDPKYRGILNVQPELLNALYLEAAKRGWQLTAHCTGEASMDVLLDCYTKIGKDIGYRKVQQQRFLITHANFASERNFAICKALHIGADMQPAWLYKDGASLVETLGERRMNWFMPLKTWFDNGLVVGGGSDHMVQLDSIESTNPWNPWLGLWTVLTRKTERDGILNPKECLTREQAIRFYTINNCTINFEEAKKGSLEPGKLADLIMIDRDILKCPIENIRDTKVLLTMVGGKIVWKKE
ncbi:MAG: putative TIM-barrel fold metal-dependent hydrolase [Verrucomicrobiales bacterium]|nr:putative TIM-barrel fold metal-dependent hydrolase [Verrucomicrobiales bacterium]